MLRRRFFALACIVTLVALFYAVENWRGKRAWETFRKTEEANGEIFDLQQIAPRAVPDEQNFAMAPIWIREITAMMGVQKARLWYGDKALANYTNSPRPLEMSRELSSVLDTKDFSTGRWVEGSKTDLAGWQNYYRQLADKTNFFPVSNLSATPAEAVLLALSRYDDVIEELREASQRPFSRFPITYSDENPVSILLPHLAIFKRVTQTLQLRASAELAAGQTDAALRDVQLMFRLLNATLGEPMLITELVRIAQFQIMLQPIWEGLVAHQWNEAQLKVMEMELAKVDFLASYSASMRGERAFGLSAMDYLERHRNSIGELVEPGNSSENVFESAIGQLLPKGWYEQNKVSLARAHRDLMFPVVDVENHRINSVAQKRFSQQIEDSQRRVKVYDWFGRFLMPALENVSRKSARAQASLDMSRIAVGLEQYRLANGSIPSSLDALVPVHLADVPHDIMIGKSYQYQRKADETYQLYSIGWNESDDGGEIVFTKGKSPAINEKLGDWVWKYRAK